MRVVRITRPGGPEVLELAEAADPSPGPEELLVRVRASALNRADLLQAMGRYPPPPGAPPDIPGLEYAGEVVAAGPRTRAFKVGDRVMGIVGGGAFAELLAVHEREAMSAPAGMELSQAAAIPEAFLTAYDALVLQGGLSAGDGVLIHAVGSGVGTAGAQIGSVVGATVIGTSRTADKLERAKPFGLTHGLVVGDPPAFAESVRALTRGRGVDVVLDLVGGDYLPQTLEALATKGRVLQVGTMGGAVVELPLAMLMHRRARLIGTVLRSRPLEEKIAVAQAFAHAMLPLFAAGRLRPVVDATMPFAQVREAFDRMLGNQTLGKICLAW